MLLIQLDTVTSCISAISSQVCFFIKSNHLNIDVCRGGRTSRVLHTPVSQKRNLGKGTVYQWFSNQNSEACKDGGIQASGCLPVQNEIGVWFKERWCGFVFVVVLFCFIFISTWHLIVIRMELLSPVLVGPNAVKDIRFLEGGCWLM